MRHHNTPYRCRDRCHIIKCQAPFRVPAAKTNYSQIQRIVFLRIGFFFCHKCSTRLEKNRHCLRAKTQKSVNLNMAETGDSVAKTQRLPFVSVSVYFTVFSCFRRYVHNRIRALFNMSLTDFGFRNHVFPQSLSCLYVAETWNSVPESCFFVPSSSRNVKIRSGCSLSVTKFFSWNFSQFFHKIIL